MYNSLTVQDIPGPGYYDVANQENIGKLGNEHVGPHGGSRGTTPTNKALASKTPRENKKFNFEGLSVQIPPVNPGGGHVTEDTFTRQKRLLRNALKEKEDTESKLQVLKGKLNKENEDNAKKLHAMHER